MMAEKMKKLLAWTIVLSMLLGVVPMGSFAEEETPPESTQPVEVTVEITNEAGSVIGEMTTVTSTQTNETDTTYTRQTDTSSSWSTQEVTGDPGLTTVSGDTTTTTTNEVTTDVTGSETTTENVHTDKTTGGQTYTGTTEGSEDTTVTDTTTTVTTTQGAELSDETGQTQVLKDGEVSEGQWSEGYTLVEEGRWQEGRLEDGDFVPISDTAPTVQGSEKIDVDADPLARDDAALNMKPDGETVSDTLTIPLEDALANDISYTDGQVLEDGSVVTFRYADDAKTQLTGYTITKHTSTGSTTGELTPEAPGGYVPDGEPVTTDMQPAGYEPCVDQPILDAGGNQIGSRTIEEILDDGGNVIGYTITDVTTGTPGILPGESTSGPAAPGAELTMPLRPEVPEPVTDEAGITTTVTLEDLVENGEVVGYRRITTMTDRDGNVTYTESENVYGTITTYSSTLKETPDTEVVTNTTVTTVYGKRVTRNETQTTAATRTTTNTRDVQQDIYELINTENGMFFLYQGKMYAVQAITGTDSDIPSHGKVTMTTLQPDRSLEPGEYGEVDSDNDLRGSQEFSVTDEHSIEFPYQYSDYALESSIQVKYYGSNTTLAHQFVLEDNGNPAKKYYVYCADFSTTAVKGETYDMVNVKDSGYFPDLETAKKVEVIAVNGYWGTGSGVGSLDHVKQVLRDAKQAGIIDLSDTEIENITPGEALSATQAALWRYADSSGETAMGDDVVGYVYDGTGYSTRDNIRSAYDSERETVNAFYKALISLDADSATNTTTELLGTGNFATEAQLVIREKAVDENGNVKTHQESDTGMYVADLTFTMAVRESDLTGNLIITVSDQYGNVIRREQLSTTSSNLVGRILADGTAGTDYTIRDLELAEGVKFNLNLSGIQNLQQGAYLYSADLYSDSQTFIGVASGSQQVNLNVQMEFSVTDPAARVQHSTARWSEKEEDIQHYTKVDTYKKERHDTVTGQTLSVNTRVFGTTVKTDVTTRVTDRQRSWSGRYAYQVAPVQDPEPDPDPSHDPNHDPNHDPTDPSSSGGDTLRKESVERADPPKTGDISGILALVCLFSAGGLAVLNRKREEDA